jgi:hypothetical protein
MPESSVFVTALHRIPLTLVVFTMLALLAKMTLLVLVNRSRKKNVRG